MRTKSTEENLMFVARDDIAGCKSDVFAEEKWQILQRAKT